VDEIGWWGVSGGDLRRIICRRAHLRKLGLPSWQASENVGGSGNWAGAGIKTVTSAKSRRNGETAHA